MAQKGFKPIRFILTGLLWSAFYLGIIMPILGLTLGFDFLSLDSWNQKYQDWLNFKWKVNNTADTILLLCMICWIPLGLLGWRFTYYLKWEKLKPAPRPQKIKKTVFELNESRPLYHMPRRMPSTVQARKYVAPKLPNQTEEVVAGQKSHTNLAQIIRQVATLAKKYKVEVFQHILLEGFRVPMAVSTDARAVLIEIVNRKKVNWSVEFTDDVTEGGWYSENGIMERLAQDLIGASKSLARSEPNSEVLSAILVTDGRVLNTKQAVEYFKSKGIFLLGYNNAEPKGDLPDLASFLSAYFDLKEGETDPSPVPVKKVPLKSQKAQSNPAPSTAGTQKKNTTNAAAAETQQKTAPAQASTPQQKPANKPTQDTQATSQKEAAAKGFRGPEVPENLKQEAPNS